MNRNTLLIVDDMEINRAILRSLFEEEYTILEAENGEQGLMLLHQYKDSIAALLLDIIMPGKDGYEVMAEMASSGLMCIIPVIVITAQDSSESEVRAFDLGASDIVPKPFEPHVVRRRLKNVVELNRHRLHLEELVAEQAANLQESRDVLMDALSSVIEHRSIESGQHVLRIRMFTKLLLEDVMHNYPEYNLDASKISVIVSAATLHDIGKIAIPDAILNKPGPLTEAEFAIMKTHTERGCEILNSLNRMHDKEYLYYAYNICRHHHERWDGKGYPDGLKEENIPICAQAVGVADAYDALTTDRVYKKAYSPTKAYNMILNGDCGQFSPQLLECFKNVRQSFVKLTREYADGMNPKPEREKITGHSLYQPPTENTGEMGEMKYFAMLRYEDSTVMEVDIDSGIYHLVYTKNNDFDLLRAGGLFQDTYRVFVARSVHPDDRAEMLNFQHGRDFLASGSTKRSHKCRVFNHDLGDYTWYQVSSLRINMADPRQHRIILVWRELAQTPKSQGRQTSQDSHALENTMVGFYQCLNDQYFTILQANRGFTALLEYSREEIAQKFNNRFLELLQPDEGQQVMAKFLKEISRKNTAELEFRLTTKSGRVIWALEKCQLFTGEDGFEYLNCVLIDITKTKAAQEKLRLTMERHQIILNQTNDIIFEWDINQDRIHYSANWLKKFGYQPITENVSQKIPQVSHLMPQDIPGFLNLMQDVIAGLAYGETEVRVADADGHYLWCRIRATTQFNAEGKPLKAIGVILDIDSEKRLAQDLIEKAKKDHLTNLYNKNAAFRRIKEFMKQEQKTTNSAMMLIDLDNFKAINDNFGHMFGDAVLIEVAGLLKKLFHLEDIIARVGGDEFLIYIHNLPQEEILAEKAKSLINAIQNILAQELQSCHLSCSIGAAYYHKDAENFHDLYQCCDRALHSAKVQGKNKCALYDKDTMSKIFDLGSQELMRPNTRIESDEAYDFETIALIQEIARDLYQNDDTDAVINSILQLIGRRYNVSRAYIFEDSADGSYCSNTFEWCSEGIEPQINQLQNVKHEDLGDYYSNFDVNGVFYCVNTETLPPQQYQIIADQGIHSMLQCIIYNNGEPAGFIGFDDCLNKRMWDQNQIKPLTLLAELLSTFLLKKRVQDKLAQGTKDLHTLLNNQNSWIYVIDPDTFKLRYLNAKTREIAPHAEEGMCCHSVFFQRATPCRLCPAQNIRAAVNTTMEVYNPVLQVWSMADASLIRWGGEEACLLSCHDITPYKQGQTSPAQGNK